MSAGRNRRRFAMAVFGSAAAVAVAAVLLVAPAFIRFVPQAPVEFWVLAVTALVVDAPLFGTGRATEARLRPTLSPGLTLAILVLFGIGPAIVVQAVAAVVSARGQRQNAFGAVFMVARLVCALLVAGFVGGRVGPVPITAPGAGLYGQRFGPYLLVAGTFAVVGTGLLVAVAAAVQRGGLPAALRAARPDVPAIVLQLLVIVPLLTTVTGWWSVVAALPLLAWSLHLRGQLRRHQHLCREPVSGLLNLHGLKENLEGLILFDPMWPERPRPVGVAFVNVESMTAIDRSLSPDVYEKVMVEGARRLAREFGADRVGRLSGEGYVVLLPGLTDPDAVSQAGDVAHVLKPIIMVDDIPFGLDPAVGVALSPDHGRELDVLVRRAQLAVGEARRLGKPAAVYVKQAQDAAERRGSVLAELHNALLDTGRHEEIAVAYQPQVELATGRLVGAEALVRWLHPEWGPVRPDELIEAVESTEVMHLLTLHMLDCVSAQLGTWRGRGHELRVAVNVSMQDLHDPAFPAQISEILRRHGIPPSQLTVEITERMLTGDAGRVKREAAKVVELGVGLSLDDFGTGYASLQQLRALPLTEVKIDKSYVNDMTDDPAQRAIVTSVHQLATALGLAVVAEGVENERTAADLAQLRGTIGQGWYIGRPVSAQVFEEEWHLQPHGQ